MADRGRLVRRLLPLVVAVVVLVTAAVVAVAVSVTGGRTSPPSDDFVTRSGATLQVDGEEFRFVGFNLYDAAATDIYSCEPRTRLDDAGLDDAMAQIADAGGTVVRFWAYQTYTDGGTNFSGVDRVIDAARDHGLRVMPALEDGPGNCSNGTRGERLAQIQDGTWYTDGYREPLGNASLSYREYAALMARHYRDEPTIVAWTLMNEAETVTRQPDGETVLVDFARDMGRVVHEADPHHLVTLGTQSNGAPGTSGPDFAAIYGLDEMDLTEVHDWGYWGADDQAMPGALPDGELPALDACMNLDADIACSFAAARELGKPIVVGEAGITARTTDSSQDARRVRADQLEAKIGAAFDAGASGYLLWQLNVLNTDGYGIIIGSDDPVYDVLRRATERWSD